MTTKELWAALLRYGHHTSNCRYMGGYDCNCGWEEAREEARKKTK